MAVASSSPRKSEETDELAIARRSIRALQSENGRLRGELDRLNGRLSEYETKLNVSWNQVRAMRASLSWRATAFLRAFRRRA